MYGGWCRDDGGVLRFGLELRQQFILGVSERFVAAGYEECQCLVLGGQHLDLASGLIRDVLQGLPVIDTEAGPAGIWKTNSDSFVQAC